MMQSLPEWAGPILKGGTCARPWDKCQVVENQISLSRVWCTLCPTGVAETKRS